MSAAHPPPAEADRAGFAATISWRQLLAVIGGASAITAVLVGVIYAGLRDDIGSVRADIRSLQQQLNAATAAGIFVKVALSEGTTPKQASKETDDAALRIGDRLADLTRQQAGTGVKLDSVDRKPR